MAKQIRGMYMFAEDPGYGLNIVSRNVYVEVNMTVFGDRIFKDIIKIKSLGWANPI